MSPQFDPLLHRLELANSPDVQEPADARQPQRAPEFGVDRAGDREVISEAGRDAWLRLRRELNRSSVGVRHGN